MRFVHARKKGLVMPPVTTALPNRAFGGLIVVVLLAVSLTGWLYGQGIHGWSLVSAMAVLLIAWLRPSWLTPATRGWLMFGQLLHRIVSPITLGVLFFGVITPMAVVMRLAGRDILLRRFNPAAPSYWVERRPAGPEAASLFRQY